MHGFSGSSTIERGSKGADKAIVEAAFWAHRHVSVILADSNRGCIE